MVANAQWRRLQNVQYDAPYRGNHEFRVKLKGATFHMSTANDIINQNSSRLTYGGDATAAAGGLRSTANPAEIARLTELQGNQNWMYAILVGGLIVWIVARKN